MGNLMQHWTLCEILGAAQRHTSCLSYVDAHAMAPMARCRTDTCRTFDRVRDGEQQKSDYEQAWRRLAPAEKGYPNSAAFVQDVWKGRVFMLLCELDSSTVAELKTWADNRNEVTVFDGDWRKRFEKGLPDAPLTLLSFDPYMYNRKRAVKKPGNLYVSDLELTVSSVDAVQGGVLLQLSTYDTNDGNPQEAVISSVSGILANGGFRRAAVARVNRKMMSLVYARGIDWFADLEDMPGRFTDWLGTTGSAAP